MRMQRHATHAFYATQKEFILEMVRRPKVYISDRVDLMWSLGHFMLGRY